MSLIIAGDSHNGPITFTIDDGADPPVPVDITGRNYQAEFFTADGSVSTPVVVVPAEITNAAQGQCMFHLSRLQARKIRDAAPVFFRPRLVDGEGRNFSISDGTEVTVTR